MVSSTLAPGQPMLDTASSRTGSATLTLKRGWPGAPEVVEAMLCVPCSLLGPRADESPSSSDESSSSPPAPWKAALAAACGSAGGREGLDREGLDRDWLEKPREGRARSAWDACREEGSSGRDSPDAQLTVKECQGKNPWHSLSSMQDQ